MEVFLVVPEKWGRYWFFLLASVHFEFHFGPVLSVRNKVLIENSCDTNRISLKPLWANRPVMPANKSPVSVHKGNLLGLSGPLPNRNPGGQPDQTGKGHKRDCRCSEPFYQYGHVPQVQDKEQIPSDQKQNEPLHLPPVHPIVVISYH
jgi:hypothetical protein